MRYEEAGLELQFLDKDQVVMRRNCRDMVQKPIKLHELFERRSITLGGPTVDVQKVLLVGDPGTGKIEDSGEAIVDKCG